MRKVANQVKVTGILVLFAGILFYGCEEEKSNQGNVELSSPTVEPDGNLSLNAIARFDADVTEMEGSPSVIYEWTLQTSRGTLIVDDEEAGNQAETSDPTVFVRGDTAGEETLKVRVINSETGNKIGEDQLTFEITSPFGMSLCYDEPMIFYRNNNWDSPGMIAYGLESGDENTTVLASQNWFFDITNDGNWFLRLDFSEQPTYKIYMDKCDGSESQLITEGLLIEYPTFGPNDEYIYYSERVDNPTHPHDQRAMEIFRVHIETGEKVMISNHKVFSSNQRVSPDGQWIAFEHAEPVYTSNGIYDGNITHVSIMPAEGGPATLLTNIYEGVLRGIDWSPDSEDLIFLWDIPGGTGDGATDGIYRVNRTGGSPFLIFAEPDGGDRIFYYNNGARIAFHGHPAGDTQYDIWSIDANGNDLQRISDAQYNVFLQFIWDP